ncbi:MAG: DMT family transporter [Chitinophagales bacterium]
MKSVTKAHIAVLCTNLFFASNYSMVKYISPSLIGPYALNVFRVAISLALFWLLWMMSKNKAGIRKEDIGRFLLCGLTGIAINQTLFIKGLTMTSPIHASLLILCTPLLITVFAFWMLKEKVTIAKAAGIALGVGGSFALIMAKENTANADNYFTGDLLIVLNAISYAFYFILVKPLMQKYSPVHVIRWIFTFGFIMILPFGWKQFNEIQWQQFEWSHITSLGFIVIAGTFLAYYFNIYGIRHIGAGTTGSYIYTQPVFAAIIATLFLHETLTTQKILAAAMIFSGVFLVSRKTPPIVEE